MKNVRYLDMASGVSKMKELAMPRAGPLSFYSRRKITVNEKNNQPYSHDLHLRPAAGSACRSVAWNQDQWR